MTHKCEICHRDMTDKSTNRHHLLPRAFGGKETIELHRICHDKLHHVFSEREMKNFYHTIERIVQHEEIQKFIKWVKNKDPDFYSSNKDSQVRKSKRKR